MSIEVEVSVECNECAAKIEEGGETICGPCYKTMVKELFESREMAREFEDALDRKKQEVIDLETEIDRLRLELRAARER